MKAASAITTGHLMASPRIAKYEVSVAVNRQASASHAISSAQVSLLRSVSARLPMMTKQMPTRLVDALRICGARGIMGLVTERAPVLARIGAADQHAAFMVDADRLPAAMRRIGPGHVMPATLKLGRRVFRHGSFEREHAQIGEAARRVERRLRIEPAFQLVRQEM